MSSAMTKAHRYHKYTYQKVEPYLGHRIVEIGCGWGTYTKMIVSGNRKVLAIDIDQEIINHCKARIDSNNVTFVQGSAIDNNCLETISQFKPDSILMMQVLEHIEDDRGLVSRLAELTEAESRLIISVPAFNSLYGPMDKEAGHFRRYTSKSLTKLFPGKDWTVEKCFYTNPLGVLGWWVNNRMLDKWTSLESSHVSSQILFFDRFVLPVSKLMELITSSIFGQSVFIIARRKQ